MPIIADSHVIFDYEKDRIELILNNDFTGEKTIYEGSTKLDFFEYYYTLKSKSSNGIIKLVNKEDLLIGIFLNDYFIGKIKIKLEQNPKESF